MSDQLLESRWANHRQKFTWQGMKNETHLNDSGRNKRHHLHNPLNTPEKSLQGGVLTAPAGSEFEWLGDVNKRGICSHWGMSAENFHVLLLNWLFLPLV